MEAEKRDPGNEVGLAYIYKGDFYSSNFRMRLEITIFVRGSFYIKDLVES